MLLAAPLALPISVVLVAVVLSMRRGGRRRHDVFFLPPARARRRWLDRRSRFGSAGSANCLLERGGEAGRTRNGNNDVGSTVHGVGSLPTAGARALPDVRVRARPQDVCGFQVARARHVERREGLRA